MDDADAGMKHEWMVASRLWQAASTLLLRLDETVQTVTPSTLLAREGAAAARAQMRDDEKGLHLLPYELPHKV